MSVEAVLAGEVRWHVAHGEALDVLRGMPDASVDAVITDPPYELGFMGKAWDASGIANSVDLWREALRVLRPGAHLLAFGGARTAHRMVCAIEDAGFEIRDSIVWLYGSGQPKSRGTLKPAHEPIACARRPVVGTIRANVAAHGTGALHIDAGRDRRWPTNIALGHAPSCRQVGTRTIKSSGGSITDSGTAFGRMNDDGWQAKPREFVRYGAEEVPAFLCAPGCPVAAMGDEARFFPSFTYEPKASQRERHAGTPAGNGHACVKPIALMRWLARLATPTGGIVVDPFNGSGSTGCACVAEGLRYIGIEREADYVEIARARIAHHEREAARPASKPKRVQKLRAAPALPASEPRTVDPRQLDLLERTA